MNASSAVVTRRGGTRSRSAPLAVLNIAVRLYLGTVLLWAGVAKALDLQESILAVDAYDVLPQVLVTPVATALPWVEIVLGLFVLAGLFTRFSGASVALLSAVFIAGMGQAKARGLAIDCGCFGGGGAGDGVGWLEILRDAPMILAGLYLLWRPRGPLQLDAVVEREEP